MYICRGKKKEVWCGKYTKNTGEEKKNEEEEEGGNWKTGKGLYRLSNFSLTENHRPVFQPPLLLRIFIYFVPVPHLEPGLCVCV